LAIFTPSIKIRPSAASIIRKSAKAKEVFPAPVLPTIPTYILFNFWKFFSNFTFSPGLISAVIPRKERSNSGLYLHEYFWKWTAPRLGQSDGGSLPLELFQDA